MKAQAAAVAAPAQAAARSSAQPPALRPQVGHGMNYFRIQGDQMGRWSVVDGDWKRSSSSGKRFMRGIPRFTNGEEMNRLSLLAHTEYWMGVFLDARNPSPKFSITTKKVLDPRLSDHMPERATFYKMHHRRRPPPPRTANTRLYFHGTFPHTVGSIAESEQFME